MEEKIRVLIVEDEFITLDLLKDYMEDSGYEVSGDSINVEEALEVLQRNDTDIVILDINLKGEKDGIWLAEQIRDTYKIPFIFLSAYSDSFTIKRAAATNPATYLVKPFKQIDVFSAIEVALKNFTSNQYESPVDPDAGESGLLHNSQFIFVKTNSVYKKIAISEIRYIQAFKNYLELHIQDQRVVIRHTLQGFLCMLPEQNFVHVHRSYVVNTGFVTEIGATHLFVDSEQIPISRTNREDLVKKMNLQN